MGIHRHSHVASHTVNESRVPQTASSHAPISPEAVPGKSTSPSKLSHRKTDPLHFGSCDNTKYPKPRIPFFNEMLFGRESLKSATTIEHKEPREVSKGEKCSVQTKICVLVDDEESMSSAAVQNSIGHMYTRTTNPKNANEDTKAEDVHHQSIPRDSQRRENSPGATLTLASADSCNGLRLRRRNGARSSRSTHAPQVADDEVHSSQHRVPNGTHQHTRTRVGASQRQNVDNLLPLMSRRGDRALENDLVLDHGHRQSPQGHHEVPRSHSINRPPEQASTERPRDVPNNDSSNQFPQEYHSSHAILGQGDRDHEHFANHSEFHSQVQRQGWYHSEQGDDTDMRGDNTRPNIDGPSRDRAQGSAEHEGDDTDHQPHDRVVGTEPMESHGQRDDDTETENADNGSGHDYAQTVEDERVRWPGQRHANSEFFSTGHRRRGREFVARHYHQVMGQRQETQSIVIPSQQNVNVARSLPQIVSHHEVEILSANRRANLLNRRPARQMAQPFTVSRESVSHRSRTALQQSGEIGSVPEQDQKGSVMPEDFGESVPEPLPAPLTDQEQQDSVLQGHDSFMRRFLRRAVRHFARRGNENGRHNVHTQGTRSPSNTMPTSDDEHKHDEPPLAGHGSDNGSPSLSRQHDERDRNVGARRSSGSPSPPLRERQVPSPYHDRAPRVSPTNYRLANHVRNPLHIYIPQNHNINGDVNMHLFGGQPPQNNAAADNRAHDDRPRRRRPSTPPGDAQGHGTRHTSAAECRQRERERTELLEEQRRLFSRAARIDVSPA